jgi:hypothetical protein
MLHLRTRSTAIRGALRIGETLGCVLRRIERLNRILTVYGQWKYSSTYLVDPASGHMLVSKIKPCMSKHKPINGEAANGSLQQPLFT